MHCDIQKGQWIAYVKRSKLFWSRSWQLNALIRPERNKALSLKSNQCILNHEWPSTLQHFGKSFRYLGQIVLIIRSTIMTLQIRYFSSKRYNFIFRLSEHVMFYPIQAVLLVLFSHTWLKFSFLILQCFRVAAYSWQSTFWHFYHWIFYHFA